MDLVALRQQIVDIFAQENMTEIPKDEFSSAKYPKLLPVMSCTVDRYRLEGFGHMMAMHGSAKLGFEILTVAMMPYEGNAVPIMLMDVVVSKKKCTLFTEYYDCTKNGTEQPLLAETAKKYADLDQYDEKPAWYVPERTSYSLIKESTDETRVKECILESFRSYLAGMKTAEKDPANLEKLAVFRERMIKEGNPATDTMNKVLGKEGAETFFRKCVMPLNSKGE